MTLTLDEVRKTKFHMARRTGYEVSEVDLFVDRVEASFAQLSEENQMLKQQVEALKQSQTRQAGPVEGAAGAKGPGQTAKAESAPAGKPVGPAGQGTAQKKLVVSTAAEASPAVIRLVQLATEQSEQLVTEAAEDAKRKIEEANRKADQITKDAESKADRTTREARSRAEDLDRQTGLRRTELFASLEQERDQLQESVSQLRGFEATYRQNFVNHLKDQLRSVESATIEPTSKPDLADRSDNRDGSSERRSQAAQSGQGTSTPRLDALLSDSQRKG